MTAHPEIAEIVQYIKEQLTGAQLFHCVVQDPDNPNVYTVAAFDEDYVNTGFVAWNEEEQRIAFLCHNPVVEKHDQLEGVPPEDSKAWWDAKSAEVFLLHLTGGVREIEAKFRRLVEEQKDLDKDC